MARQIAFSFTETIRHWVVVKKGDNSLQVERDGSTQEKFSGLPEAEIERMFNEAIINTRNELKNKDNFMEVTK